jgi:hypothetical protein
MSDVVQPFPHTSPKTARQVDKLRTEYFELMYALRRKDLQPAAKATLKRKMADNERTLSRAWEIAKRESKKYNAAQGPYEGGIFTPKSPSPNDLSKNRNQRPKSPSSSNLPRSAAGVKTTTKTVNKLYRPMGK